MALVHCADVIALRLMDDNSMFEKGIDFDPAALELLHLTDSTVLQSLIETYKEVLQSDIDQVTSLSNTARN